MPDPATDFHGVWRPAWYPNQDPQHNPWTTAEPISGLTHYQVWVGKLAPGELADLIAEQREVSA
jgi:hypothetical protein